MSGSGARRKLSVRGPVALSEAEGTVPLDLYGPERWAEILSAFDGTRSARSPRCSCHEYRMLAMGLADFSANASLKPWDPAAGALVLEDAGGIALVEGGRRYAPTLREGRVGAGGSEALAPGKPLEDGRAELGLESADPPLQGRGGEVHVLGGLAHRARPGHRLDQCKYFKMRSFLSIRKRPRGAVQNAPHL